jgi:hypothetical protein
MSNILSIMAFYTSMMMEVKQLEISMMPVGVLVEKPSCSDPSSLNHLAPGFAMNISISFFPDVLYVFEESYALGLCVDLLFPIKTGF